MEKETVSFPTRAELTTEDITAVEAFRATDNRTDSGCWVEGVTPYIEEDESFLYVVRLDSNSFELFYRHPDELTY